THNHLGQGQALFAAQPVLDHLLALSDEADAARNRLSWLKVNENGQMSRLPYHDGDVCFDACETLFLCEMAT
ncbi:MAG: hypothetical protein RR821_15225, partial [Clostridia bacterium]